MPHPEYKPRKVSAKKSATTKGIPDDTKNLTARSGVSLHQTVTALAEQSNMSMGRWAREVLQRAINAGTVFVVSEQVVEGKPTYTKKRTEPEKLVNINVNVKDGMHQAVIALAQQSNMAMGAWVKEVLQEAAKDKLVFTIRSSISKLPAPRPGKGK